MYAKSRRTKPAGKPVYNNSGRVCGTIIGDRLCKNVHSNHMLRKPEGWAWDRSILEQAIRAGVKKTVIRNTDDGVIYEASLEDIMRIGVDIDRGFGAQKVLPIKYWQQKRPGEAAQASLF